MYAIRGATTISKNSSQEINICSIELFEEIIKKNCLKLSDIVSIIFSCTEDITKDYPGKFIREYYKLNNVAIMHFNEMKVDNSLSYCIRILILCNGEKDKINYVYLRNSKSLRKDLLNESNDS
ncbi:chorismate mutase [Clostridium lundense]|uniref:chorismate mutase n=1 Tax=Clostridium lundense TaxID=319475 RepID=UPI00047FB73E|nr:chorismate mutase [Clostridium lundense]